MQLTHKKSIRRTLTAVTAVLIGSTMASAADGNKIESSLLLYSETDRVQAAEGTVGLTRTIGNGRSFRGIFTFDALTGPSPNGATPSNSIQTFTRPSGQGVYTVQPGDIPLDDTFRDTRVSFDGSYTTPLNRLTNFDIGGHFSTEHDYTSLGANVGLSRDLNRKNTTLSASLAFAHDLINPEGGSPMPFALLSDSLEDNGGNDEDEFEGGGESSNETKNTFDAVVGVTQVLGRQTLLRLNYSFSHASGYLNDPYKLLSVVQNASGTSPGEPIDYIFESRPGSRNKHALYGELRRYLGGHTIDLSYRYFWDDWGVTSHTIDLHYRLPLKSGHALQPHVRLYSQSAADFYRPYLLDGSSIPTHASADYRLAKFSAVTLGLQYLLPVGPNAHLNIGGEYYYQSGDVSPPETFGALGEFDLFPDLKALMIRVGFGYDF